MTEQYSTMVESKSKTGMFSPWLHEVHWMWQLPNDVPRLGLLCNIFVLCRSTVWLSTRILLEKLPLHFEFLMHMIM